MKQFAGRAETRADSVRKRRGHTCRWGRRARRLGKVGQAAGTGILQEQHGGRVEEEEARDIPGSVRREGCRGSGSQAEGLRGSPQH